MPVPSVQAERVDFHNLVRPLSRVTRRSSLRTPCRRGLHGGPGGQDSKRMLSRANPAARHSGASMSCPSMPNRVFAAGVHACSSRSRHSSAVFGSCGSAVFNASIIAEAGFQRFVVGVARPEFCELLLRRAGVARTQGLAQLVLSDHVGAVQKQIKLNGHWIELQQAWKKLKYFYLTFTY